MKLLAFDTSTETMSIAVTSGGELRRHDAPGGAQASSTLIPTIQRLLAELGLTLGQLDAIAFGRGPGSFTGLRTACSVAQGLAFGARVPVLAVDTLLALAEEARFAAGCDKVLAVLDARMDEVYTAPYEYRGGQWTALGPARLCKPQDVQLPDNWAAQAKAWSLAGNAFLAYGQRLPACATVVPALPTAAGLLRLAPALLAAGQAQDAACALPLYIRDKVAQTTEERAALRSAQPTAP